MLVFAFPATMGADAEELRVERALQQKLISLEARLDAQEEARDRQADAFSAATSRIEIVNGALVGLIALAGVLGFLLAIRSVRQLAHAQVETAIERAGKEIFEADSAELREEYDEKFAALYRRYHQLVDEAQ